MTTRISIVSCIAVGALAAAMFAAQSPSLAADGLKCDMTQYKAGTGPTAAMEQDLLVGTWPGQAGSELRARYAIDRAQPVVRDLAVRKQGGQWATLGQNLVPEYHVVSGLRRMSSDHVASLPAAGIPLTPEVVAKNRWFAFHDAPLEVPGVSGTQNPPLARKPVELAGCDPLVEQLRHFVTVIAGREQPLISVEDAMGTLAVVEAVSEGARTGQRVSPAQIVEQAA